MTKETTTDLATTEDYGTDLVFTPEEEAALAAVGSVLTEACTLATTKIGYRDGGGKFRLPDETYVETFNGVIVAAKHANIHYPAAYVKGQPSGADCVAVRLGNTDTDFNQLVPIPQVEAPYASACGACKNLQWGSSTQPGSKGKACAETLLLALYIPQLGEDLYVLECRRKWGAIASNYVNNTARAYKAPLAVLSEFKIGSDTSPWEQSYRTVSRNPSELVRFLIGRIDEASSMLEAHVRNSLRQEPALEVATESDPATSGRTKRERA